MKKFISKNWKQIFLIACGLFIIIDLIFIITVPATIPQDFLEYGPDIETDIIDGTGELSDNIKDSDSSASEAISKTEENLANKTGASLEFSHGLVIFAIGLIAIFILSAIMDKDGGGDKKKKK